LEKAMQVLDEVHFSPPEALELCPEDAEETPNDLPPTNTTSMELDIESDEPADATVNKIQELLEEEIFQWLVRSWWKECVSFREDPIWTVPGVFDFRAYPLPGHIFMPTNATKQERSQIHSKNWLNICRFRDKQVLKLNPSPPPPSEALPAIEEGNESEEDDDAESDSHGASSHHSSESIRRPLLPAPPTTTALVDHNPPINPPRPDYENMHYDRRLYPGPRSSSVIDMSGSSQELQRARAAW
jgi:hypothetical protein